MKICDFKKIIEHFSFSFWHLENKSKNFVYPNWPEIEKVYSDLISDRDQTSLYTQYVDIWFQLFTKSLFSNLLNKALNTIYWHNFKLLLTDRSFYFAKINILAIAVTSRQ